MFLFMLDMSDSRIYFIFSFNKAEKTSFSLNDCGFEVDTTTSMLLTDLEKSTRL